MKTTIWLISLLIAGAFLLAACSKSEKAPPSQGPNVAKLQQAFPTPTPEIQASLAKVAFGFRYGQYPEALAELDKIAADPSLTEAQKKAVTEFSEELKKKAASPAPPAQ